jgi:predicted Ser/Thr protein kinase
MVAAAEKTAPVSRPAPAPPAPKPASVPVARTAPAPPQPTAHVPPAPAPKTGKCPSCGAKISSRATACPECGFLVQDDEPTLESESEPCLCPNEACGVANSAGHRFCQRCNSPLPLPQGTMIQGRYRIDKMLAIGGFAVVYLAIDTKQGNRPVAVKDMIVTDKQEFAIRLNFFEREAEILHELETLQIVPRLYEFIKEGQSAYLILEYIQGQDLLKLMENTNNQPFPVDQVVEWGKSISDVLIHMHGMSPPIVHRDVKPDNIMLLDDRCSIKMIDFGTARDVGRSTKGQKSAKTRVYTEGYAPPEQIVGKPEPRSDVFALAGTLYHLATGKAPEGFYTARELETQLAGSNGAIRPEHRWFFELIQINLAEDVNDRYCSCKEFQADLQRRQVTRERVCPKCQTTNPRGLPFCTKCAEPLTDAGLPCECGKTNRMGSRFCIHCGHRLR